MKNTKNLTEGEFLVYMYRLYKKRVKENPDNKENKKELSFYKNELIKLGVAFNEKGS